MTIGIAIIDTQAITWELVNNKRLQNIGKKGVVCATSNGKIIAVSHPDSKVRCYSAHNGAYLTTVGNKDAISLNIVGKHLVISYENRRPQIIDLKQAQSKIKNVEARLSAYFSHVLSLAD